MCESLKLFLNVNEACSGAQIDTLIRTQILTRDRKTEPIAPTDQIGQALNTGVTKAYEEK